MLKPTLGTLGALATALEDLGFMEGCCCGGLAAPRLFLRLPTDDGGGGKLGGGPVGCGEGGNLSATLLPLLSLEGGGPPPPPPPLL